ncbi:hypothetical protein Droror1_Dr00006340 [Drosera rotundifolia]
MTRRMKLHLDHSVNLHEQQELVPQHACPQLFLFLNNFPAKPTLSLNKPSVWTRLKSHPSSPSSSWDVNPTTNTTNLRGTHEYNTPNENKPNPTSNHKQQLLHHTSSSNSSISHGCSRWLQEHDPHETTHPRTNSNPTLQATTKYFFFHDSTPSTKQKIQQPRTSPGSLNRDTKSNPEI